MKFIVLVLTFFWPLLSQADRIPANAHKVPYVDSWECNRGFKDEGGQCVRLVLPPNAKLDITGNSWECNRGYREKDNACEKFTLPKNAHFDATGNSWECNRGFREDGDGCVVMNSEEMKSQLDMEKQIRLDMRRRQVKGVFGDFCDMDIGSLAKVCGSISKDRINISCSEAYGKKYYEKCTVSIPYTAETNYVGRGFINADIKCDASIGLWNINAKSNPNYDTPTTTQSADKNASLTLFKLGMDMGTIEIDFDINGYWSESDRYDRAKLLSTRCRFQSVFAF